MNIGPRQARLRFQSGIVSLAIGVAGGAVLVWLGPSHWWRLALFLPFWVGFLGLLQARTKT